MRQPNSLGLPAAQPGVCKATAIDLTEDSDNDVPAPPKVLSQSLQQPPPQTLWKPRNATLPSRSSDVMDLDSDDDVLIPPPEDLPRLRSRRQLALPILTQPPSLVPSIRHPFKQAPLNLESLIHGTPPPPRYLLRSRDRPPPPPQNQPPPPPRKESDRPPQHQSRPQNLPPPRPQPSSKNEPPTRFEPPPRFQPPSKNQPPQPSQPSPKKQLPPRPQPHSKIQPPPRPQPSSKNLPPRPSSKKQPPQPSSKKQPPQRLQPSSKKQSRPPQQARGSGGPDLQVLNSHTQLSHWKKVLFDQLGLAGELTLAMKTPLNLAKITTVVPNRYLRAVKGNLSKKDQRGAGIIKFPGSIEILPAMDAMRKAYEEHTPVNRETQLPSRLVLWTDGAHRAGNKGHAGFAVVYRQALRTEWSPWTMHGFKSIGQNAGCWEMECLAVIKAIDIACEMIRHGSRPVKVVTIYTDATQTLDLLRTQTPTRMPIIQILIKKTKALRAMGAELSLHWCPGHSRVPGNELADRVAGYAGRYVYNNEDEWIDITDEEDGDENEPPLRTPIPRSEPTSRQIRTNEPMRGFFPTSVRGPTPTYEPLRRPSPTYEPFEVMMRDNGLPY